MDFNKQINIDKQIDNDRCPALHRCTCTLTSYDRIENKHLCYLCWKQYCNSKNVEIIYN